MTLVSLTVIPSSVTLVPGATAQLTAIGAHDDNSKVDLTASVMWASTNGAAASVSLTGLVTGVAAGGAVITATNASPSLSDTCVVDVVEATTTCWNGAPSAFESRMLQPLPTYALESLRLRFMFSAVENASSIKGARSTLQMAFETEMRVALVKMIELSAGVLESKVCERRRFIDIDRDMQRMRFLIGPALDELANVSTVPTQYVDLIRRFVIADYPRYRVCAIAATLCLATAVLVP